MSKKSQTEDQELESLDESRKPRLTLISKGREEEVYDLNQDSTVIGRGVDVDLVIKDRTISRRQAMIVKSGSRYLISDLESSNGTLVNRLRIAEPTVLMEGDSITLGNLMFRFSFLDADVTQSLPNQAGSVVTDELTSVYNRAYFLDSLRKEFDYSRRTKAGMGLILCGIDHFELLNDTYCREAGDVVLKGVASALIEQARMYDLVSRFTGDQFAIIFRGGKLEELQAMAERLRLRIENQVFSYQEHDLSVTVSAGIVVYSGDNSFNSSGQMIQALETNLALAKRSGRNRVCC